LADAPPPILAGRLTLYRFFDVGYAIDLAAAERLLPAGAVRRHPPAQARQAGSVQVAQPPLRVDLGPTPLAVEGFRADGQLRASLYDLGAIAVALEVPLRGPLDWPATADLLSACQDPPDEIERRFDAAVAELERTLGGAIARPARDEVVEDYTVLIVDRLAGDATAAVLADDPLVQAALHGESRPLGAESAGLVTRLRYLPDDLALLSWSAALFLDPEPLGAETAADQAEFAKVELLVMRTNDTDLEAQLPAVNRRVAGQRRFNPPLVRRYSRLLGEVQALVLEVTEVTERVDNALKVTDDVYWNRLYSALVESLRVDVWRRGVEHKLALLRETYAMLHADADAERAWILELMIVLLIVVEIALALLRSG
jgi:hypothetical protein